MGTVIATVETHEIETRRNRFKEPWPSTIARFAPSRMSAEFVGPGTAGAYVVGTVTEVGSAYFGLLGVDARVPVTPGETIEWSADTSATGTLQRRLRVFFMDSAGAIISTPLIESPFETVGEWRRQFVSVVVPEGAAYSGIYVLMPATALGQQLFVRKVYAGIPGEYFNGSMPPLGNKRYAWAGAVNGSESIEYSTVPVVTVAPVVVDGFRSARPARTLVHPILGAEGPDVSLRPAGLRAGTLSAVFASEADAHAAEQALAVPRLYTLSDPDVPAVGMTFVPAEGDIELELDDTTRNSWVLRVPFQEVTP